MLINYGYNFTLFLHAGKNRLTIVGNFLFLVFEIQFGFPFIISGLYEPNEEKRGFMAYKVEQSARFFAYMEREKAYCIDYMMTANCN